MHHITKKWDRQDTFAFTFGGACLLATVFSLGLGLGLFFTAIALGFSFALWLRT